MNRKNKNKNDQFISLSDDYEDDDSFDDEDYVEEEEFIKKKKRRASEGDLEQIKKNKHLKNNYFNNLSKNEQKIILEKETEIYKFLNDHTPLRYNIINSNLYLSTKSMILQKIDQFEEMSQEETEYHKLSKWINSLSKIPFNNYSKMILEIKPNKVQYFLMNSYQKLDKTIYGQYKAKNKIMQVLAQWISNPDSMGQVIACEGPAGVGKTSLIKNGVSDVLNRPFSFYALGGANDISVLEGHSYTYEGAIYGRLIEMLIETKIMNPIIFFDELDKISNDEKGNNIENLLIHLTDPSQNNCIYDKYFNGIEIDFSKSLLFFSFNNIHKINPILKDRLTIIKFEGYTIDEKIIILKEYLLDEIIKNIGLQKNDIIFNEHIFHYIITKYTGNEEGMRNTKRIFEELLLQINLIKLLNDDQYKKKCKNLHENFTINYNIIDLKFPLELNENIIDILLKNYN
jgi:ATP-dependent Lon protease